MPSLCISRLIDLLVRLESDTYEAASLSRNNDLSARLERIRERLERLILNLQQLCNYDAVSVVSDTPSSTSVFEVD